MSNTVDLLNGLEYLYKDNVSISQLKRTLHKFPKCEIAMTDAFSLGQLKSKLWLIENLPDNLGTIFVCAGWYGTLSALMFERCRNKFDKIRSFDIDETCAPIADTMNRSWVLDGWQFKASTLDIMNMEYPTIFTTHRANGTSLKLTEMPDTIINTSCEHIYNFSDWFDKIPSGTILILQGNDFFDIKEHVNCNTDIEDFNKMTPMSKTLYLGELPLPLYSRFMKIGIK